MSSTVAELEYAFDNSAIEAETQFGSLERYLDPITRGRLAPPVLGTGKTCWEVGAGGGSIARLLARVVGPTGRVVATDLDPSHLAPEPNLAVHRHDVRTGTVPGGPFDVIHARLVLLHVPERRRVLRDLVGALAPGGWLVVEEFDCTTPRRGRVLTAPTDADAAMFTEVLDAILGVLEQRGADLGWAQRVHTEMSRSGLRNIDTVVYSESWAGGSSGAALYDVNSRQLQPQLEELGISGSRLEAFRQLTRDPRFAALSYEFVSTRGQKPYGVPTMRHPAL